jgi:hypothetical protein
LEHRYYTPRQMLRQACHLGRPVGMQKAPPSAAIPRNALLQVGQRVHAGGVELLDQHGRQPAVHRIICTGGLGGGGLQRSQGLQLPLA